MTAPCFRPYVDQRKVARAAAKIADENQFVMVETALVKIRSGNRFVLEKDVPDTGLFQSSFQPFECEIVVLIRARIRITYRPSHNNRSLESADLFSGLRLQVAQDDRNQVLNRELPAENICRSEQAAGQKRFERLDQASLFVRFQISFDGSWTSRDGSFGLKIKDRPVGLRRTRSRGKTHGFDRAACIRHGNRTVRCSEIQPNGSLHFQIICNWNCRAEGNELASSLCALQPSHFAT